MCEPLGKYRWADVAIFHFLREGKKLFLGGWFVRLAERQARLARSETSTSDYTHALVVQHSCNYTRPTHYGNNEQWRMLYVAPAIAHTCWY